jgi:hypothetical protein
MALLVAHLHELRRDQIDDVVDLFDQFMGELMRKGERAQEQHVLQHAKTMNAYLWRFADGLEAFLQALADDRDPSLALLQELREGADASIAKPGTIQPDSPGFYPGGTAGTDRLPTGLSGIRASPSSPLIWITRGCFTMR